MIEAMSPFRTGLLRGLTAGRGFSPPMLFRPLLLALALLLIAQAQPSAQTAPAAPEVQSVPPVDIGSIDNTLRLLKDERSRSAMIAELESLRASLSVTAENGQRSPAAGAVPPEQPASAQDAPPTGEVDRAAPPAVAPVPTPAPEPAPAKPAPAEAAPAPDEQVILTEGGLMGAVTSWIGDVGERLPQAALGAPIEQKLDLATQQIGSRLTDQNNWLELRTFGIKAAAGWAIAFLVGYGLWTLPWLRARTKVHRRSRGLALLRDVAVRTLFGLIPLVASAVILVAWPSLAGMSPFAGEAFALLAVPFWFALLGSRLFHHLLEFLGSSRGWRLVGYAQKRLTPWITRLVFIAMVSVVLRNPVLRSLVGIATADVASFLVDLLFNFVALLFVLKHRFAVRGLLVKGKLSREVEGKYGPFETALIRLGKRWHVLAIVFIVLNVVARLFGTSSQGFVLQACVSVVFLIAGSTLAAWIRTHASRAGERLKLRRTSTRGAIMSRVVRLVAIVAQAAIIIAVLLLCLRLWGMDFAGWFRTEPGLTILRSFSAIAGALLASWATWIILDSWIDHALTPVDHYGRPRPQSNRVKTLLPLLRNFAFVTISVLTAIAVLANLGVNVAPLLAGAGVVGLAIGFGSQQLVQDVITGLFILLEDTIAIGDVIDTGDRAGVVEALTIRTVRIRDGEGALHSIPFSSIKALKNRSRDFGVYTLTVTIDHHANVQKALDAMREVGASLVHDPQFAHLILLPLDVWGVDAFMPEGIVLKGAIRTRPLEQWGVGRELNRRLKQRLDELGIELAHRNLELPDRLPSAA
jgi:small conductance mechanosensitive channel